MNWVIVGGESGPNARPMNAKWVYDIRDQCLEVGVPFFFKQWGEWLPKMEYAYWGVDEILKKQYQMSDKEATGWVVKPEFKGAIQNNDNWGVVEYDGTYLPQTTTWNGRQMSEVDEWEHTVYRVGKKNVGRLLDGVEWSQFPLN